MEEIKTDEIKIPNYMDEDLKVILNHILRKLEQMQTGLKILGMCLKGK